MLPWGSRRYGKFVWLSACCFGWTYSWYNSLQLLRTRRPFVAYIYDGLGNELFRVFTFPFLGFGISSTMMSSYLDTFLLLFGLWSVYIAYIQVRRPFWWITSSIFVEINGKVCKPALLVTFKIFSFHIIHRYVLCLYAQEIGVVHRRWHLWRRIYDLYLGWVSGCTYDISCSSKNKKDNSKLWDTFESVVPVDESLVKKYESLAYRLVMELNNVMWTQQSANN